MGFVNLLIFLCCYDNAVQVFFTKKNLSTEPQTTNRDHILLLLLLYSEGS